MWNLERPDTADVREHLDTVFPVGAAPVVVSEANKDELLALYDDYDAADGRPEPELKGDAFSDQVKQAVHDAYAEVQERGKLKALRESLKLLALECPYCGFGEIQDLDHHLPKGVFKPMSIFALNLVPCCATCNRKKPRVPRADPRTHSLHAYLEDVSQYDFLRANVGIDAADGSLQVQFSVVQPANMSAELHARLKNHFLDFALHERYPAQINIYLSSFEAAFEMAFTSGGRQGMRDFLDRSAEKNAARFGINDWRTALLRGLVLCDEFCDGGFIVALGFEV